MTKTGLWVTQGHRTDTYRSAIYEFLLTFPSNHGPILYRFRDKRWFQSKIAKIFPLPCILCAAWNWVSEHGVKKNDEVTWRRKKLDDIFSPLNTIQERDGRPDTGRQQRPRLRVALRGNKWMKNERNNLRHVRLWRNKLDRRQWYCLKTNQVRRDTAQPAALSIDVHSAGVSSKRVSFYPVPEAVAVHQAAQPCLNILSWTGPYFSRYHRLLSKHPCRLTRSSSRSILTHCYRSWRQAIQQDCRSECTRKQVYDTIRNA